MKMLYKSFLITLLFLSISITVTAKDFAILNDLETLEVKIIGLQGVASKNVSISEINRYGVEIHASEKIVFVDYDGNEHGITSSGDNDCRIFSDGIAAIMVNGKWGYINQEYEWIVQPFYTSADDFSNGLGVLRDNGNSYVVNTFGEVVFKSDGNIRSFVGGIALITDEEDKNYKILDENLILHDASELQGYFVCDYNYGYILGRNEENNNTQVYALFNSDGNIVSSYDMGAYYPHTGGKCLPNGKAIVFGAGDVESNGTKIHDEKTVLFSKDGESTSINEDIFEDYSVYKIGHFDNEYIITCSGEIYNYELNKIGELNIDSPGKEVIASGDVIAVLPLMTSKTMYDDYGDYIDPWIECDKVVFMFTSEFLENYKSPAYVDSERVPGYNSNRIHVYLNNVSLTFDKPPITENDRTLVPMRAIFEALGADVKWDNETNTAIAEREGTSISIAIDSDIMYKNGEAIPLDAPARLIDDGYTFIPLRAVSEAFGCTVKWTEELQRVDILKSE